MRLFKSTILAALVLGTGIAARSRQTSPPAREARAPARVRFVQVTAPGRAFDLRVGADKEPLVSGLGFGAATPYIALSPDPVTATITVSGNPREPVGTLPLPLSPSRVMTMLIVGGAEEPRVRALALDDGNDPPPAGKARVRFVHAAPGLPAVDIALNGDILLGNLAPDRAAEVSLLIDSGAYSVTVNPTGRSQTLAEPLTLTLRSGVTYTVVVLPNGRVQAFGDR